MTLPGPEPFVLFVRHAARAEIPPDDPFADVDLTPAGYAAARAMAEGMKGRVQWAASSPFLRCRATARAFGHEPEDDTRLGRHGPWVFDHEAAGREFARLGTEGVVRAQIAGAALSGLRGPDAAVPFLLSSGLDRLRRGSGICVTHDAVLMPAIAWLFGADAAGAWLAPLDGFAVYLRGGAPVAVWRDRERPC
ncbi:MAG: histidine phosphatase family protein [Myxococcales bacterium]|nr:histidine phosphatase family protein [Myxococcales bacterium]